MKTIVKMMAVVWVALVAGAAWAQSTVPVELPTGFDDPAKLAELAYTAVMAKNWGLLASIVVMATVAALRTWVPEHTKVGKALRTKVGGVATNFAFSLGGALATMYLSTHTLTAALVFQAISVALGAAGGWSIIKNIREHFADSKATAQAEADAKAAVVAGTDASKAPTDTLNK